LAPFGLPVQPVILLMNRIMHAHPPVAISLLSRIVEKKYEQAMNGILQIRANNLTGLAAEP
jgi:hypothetical protein